MSSDGAASARSPAARSLRTLDHAWTLLLAVAARRRAGTLPGGPIAFRWHDDDTLEHVGPDDPQAVLRRLESGVFAAGPALEADTRDFVELYLPMLGGRDDGSTVVAHLGQSVDGYIATASGHSVAVTGRADFVHMHRLRALADAVLVGAGTVAADDPRLTTRMVDGPSPVRVVVDPRARLADTCGVFTDGAAPTLRVHAAGDGDRAPDADADRGVADRSGDDGLPGHVDTLTIGTDADGLSLPDLLEALRERDIRVVFIEGGGVTVTRWLQAGLLDRLHVTVAPVLIGDGRPALRLPAIATMDESLRPRCRLHLLGQDVLWDFDLRDAPEDGAADRDGHRRLT